MTSNNHGNYLNRRAFLRRIAAVGGAAALAQFIEGCTSAGIELETQPAPTSIHTETPMPNTLMPKTPTPQQPMPDKTAASPSSTTVDVAGSGNAKLAFVKTGNRAEGVRTAVELLGGIPINGKRVFLKPNFNSADPTPGSTHLDVLATLVTLLNEMGAREITVGDRSGMGNTRQVMEQKGVFDLANQLGFNSIVFDELGADDWVMVQPEGGHWKDGFLIARPCLDTDALVQTCCLKTHRYGGHFTLSLKNSVGMVAKRHPVIDHDLMTELHNSPHQRRMIAEINAAYSPALIVMDGVEAFISGGPDTGERVSPEVIIAGTDRIAIDAVGVALLRYYGCKTDAAKGKIFEQEQIARAVELGLGVNGPGKIEFITGDPDSQAYSQAIKEVLAAG